MEDTHIMPKISIIVPAYNCEKTLKRCIDSIINQTYKNIEIIIIDDGSTDSTPQLCDEYNSCYDYIKVVHSKNSGPSSARNTGISLSTGEYITFVDSDDYISESMYQTMITNIGNADVIMCNFHMFKDDNSFDIDIKQMDHFMGNKSYESQYIMKKGCFEQDIVGINMVWNKLYKSDIIKNNNILFDKNTTVEEDLLFNIDVFSKCETIYMLNDKLYFYLIERKDSIMFNEKTNLDWTSMLKRQQFKIEKAKNINIDIDVNRLYYPVLLQIHEYINRKIKNNIDTDKVISILSSQLYRDALKYDKLLPRGVKVINIFTKINPLFGLAMYKLICK